VLAFSLDSLFIWSAPVKSRAYFN